MRFAEEGVVETAADEDLPCAVGGAEDVGADVVAIVGDGGAGVSSGVDDRCPGGVSDCSVKNGSTEDMEDTESG
jgi:hypothetical protein